MHKVTLTEDQLHFYREQGYLIVPDVWTPNELESIRSAVDEAYVMRFDNAHDSVGSNPQYDQVFQQKVNLWQVHEGIRRHTFSPKLAELARQITGADAIRLWHDQTLVKQPGGNLPTPYHQDLTYWPMIQDGALTAWTALDDVNERNACLRYVPGSHKWGMFEGVDFTDPKDVPEIVGDHADEVREALAVMSAGSVVFHHCLTFHGATANVTDKPRRAMIVHYHPDGTQYNGKPHIVSDGRGLSLGDPLSDDEMWPILARGC
jgi:ectoine hydroxylase-related dioxygenase (phytanoyl-CoA dioxygenase family)